MSEGGRGELTGVVDRNIRSLSAVRRRLEEQRSRSQRMADAITRFTGSMRFVYLHAAVLLLWLLWNLGLLGLTPLDPYPFMLLAMGASVEAIFLSTFVLISQNRMLEISDKRAELDLQVNLLAEHEVTRAIKLLDAIARRLDIDVGESEHLEELERDVHPEEVLEEIERVEAARRSEHPPPE